MGSDLTGFFSEPFVGPTMGMLCFFAVLILVIVLVHIGILYTVIKILKRRAQNQPKP